MFTRDKHGNGSGKIGGERDLILVNGYVVRLERVNEFELHPSPAELEESRDRGVYPGKRIMLARPGILGATYGDERCTNPRHC